MEFAGAIMTLAAGCWIAALIVLVRLSRMLNGTRSLWVMLFNGIQWFNPGNFVPEAAGLVRALRLLTAGFFACVLLLAAIVLVMQL
jgi:hypothetical protein